LIELAEFVYEAVDIFAQLHGFFDTGNCGLCYGKGCERIYHFRASLLLVDCEGGGDFAGAGGGGGGGGSGYCTHNILCSTGV
jgi:hypothetical protein